MLHGVARVQHVLHGHRGDMVAAARPEPPSLPVLSSAEAISLPRALTISQSKIHRERAEEHRSLTHRPMCLIDRTLSTVLLHHAKSQTVELPSSLSLSTPSCEGNHTPRTTGREEGERRNLTSVAFCPTVWRTVGSTHTTQTRALTVACF